MLSFLSEIVHGILDLPYVLINLIVGFFNLIIAAIAALAKAVLALLPSLPAAPSAPGGVVGAVLWFVPLGTILSFFTLMIACWTGFLAIKIALKWVKAL